jgi:hypothetical protein
VTKLVGTKPAPLEAGLPVLEGLGGIWPSSSFYQQLQYKGPSYEGGCVVKLAAKKTCALVEYEHVVRMQALLPQNSLLASEVVVDVSLTLGLGTIQEPAFIPKGTVVDANLRVLILSPESFKELCGILRGRAPKVQVCAMALPLSLTLVLKGMHVSVGLDFWVQILETKSSLALYPYITSDSLHGGPAAANTPRKPFPRLVLPADSTPGKEGMALYSSAHAPLAVQCGTSQKVRMQVRDMPSLPAMAVNRLHPTVWTKAVPLKALRDTTGQQSDGDGKVPVQLVEAIPTSWQAWDSWSPSSVTVTGDQVEVSLAPACGATASVGLHMVCLQLSYALDDECMGGGGGAAECMPSNFGCRLENPNNPGRCFVTSAPSRCIHYLVTDAAATVVARHTAAPPLTPTPAPPPPPPPPLQPTLVPVGEAPQTVRHGNTTVHHVLDFPRGLHLPDPQVQIQRYHVPATSASLPPTQAPVCSGTPRAAVQHVATRQGATVEHQTHSCTCTKRACCQPHPAWP